MLSYEIKKFLVDNREDIVKGASKAVGLAAGGLITSAGTIIFNIHNVERKIIVRDNPDEDFIELEEMSWTNELRDLLHDSQRRSNLLSHFGSDEEKKKKKKKKKESKEKENTTNGVLIN